MDLKPSSSVLVDDGLPAADLPARLLLSAIVESSDDAILSKTLDGTITSWNRAAQRMFGYSAPEILGRSVLTLVPEELQQHEPEILARIAQGERIEHYETIRVARDGRRLDVSLTVSPVRDESGRVVGASKVVRDIGEQKRAREIACHLAAIVESSDDAIVSKNLRGIVSSWNRSAERIFGYSAAEMVGQSILRIIPPELQHEEADILGRLQRGERIDHLQTVRVRKDGSRIHVSLTISPIRGLDGRVIGISKIARDMSHFRRADQATRLLAAIVDSSDDAIVSKNLNGIITSWNAGAERIFGYTAAEMIGRPVATLFPPDRLDEEPLILARLQRGERVDHYETIRLRKGGTPLHVSLTISPIRDTSGTIVGASKVARDITEQKRTLEQLARANEELKRADRMKSEFLAVMSHELRTPLNSIIGFASVLRQGRQGPVNDEQKKQLNLIHASGKHLLHLINDLLDLSRIEAGRMEIEPEEFAIEELIQEAIRTLELQIAQKSLVLRQELKCPEFVYTDRKRLFQVVLNLLNNAIKFTPRGTVTISARCEGDQLVVSVADTGIGIAKEKQSNLFHAFSQIEGSTRRRFEGTGLGLYLCKKIVTLLGGSIDLESELGHGAVFTFRIPLRHAESVSAPPFAPAPPA